MNNEKIPLPAIKASVFAALFLFAAALRLMGTFNDLWLDEIWSLAFLTRITSPLDIFTRIHHDNNHWLNTLYLYIIGDQRQWFIYRLFSFITGAGAVAVAGSLAARRSRPAAFAAVVLTGFSYLMVLYSSEARGYAPALFFSLLSFYFMQQYIDKGRRLFSLLFALCAVLGFLSHLTYAFVYFAILFWSIFTFFRTGKSRGNIIVEGIICHSAPLLALAALYLLDIRHMSYGGGNRYTLTEVIADTVTLAWGAPDTKLWAILIGIAVLGIIIFELVMLAREKNDVWILFLSVVFLLPAVVFMFLEIEIIFVRYFLVCVLFVFLAFAGFLGRCYNHGVAGKIFYVAALGFFLWGNGLRIGAFLEDGRGRYLDAVRYMARETKGQIITVGSDHDFRNRVLLVYYARYLPPGKKIIYFDSRRLQGERPQWYIMHSQDQYLTPVSQISGPGGDTWQLAMRYPYAGLSGWQWFIYRPTQQ